MVEVEAQSLPLNADAGNFDRSGSPGAPPLVLLLSLRSQQRVGPRWACAGAGVVLDVHSGRDGDPDGIAGQEASERR